MRPVVEVVMFIVHFIMMIIIWALEPVFAWLYEGQRKRKLVPPSSQLLLKSATELARMVRAKEVSCVELVIAFRNRVREVNSDLNAVVAERFEEAITEAKELDRVLELDSLPEAYSQQNAPFLGVPFTAKEAFAIAGMPNTSGLLSRRNVIADCDAATVSLMKKAGAIPVAVTNCSELCMWWEASNLHYGRTNNPYHFGRIVGGSSGGEGAIIAAAGSVVGIGSDVGGSIRIPAYFNGIFGHKPSQCVVDNTGQFPNGCGLVKEYLVTGPMCRYAEDLLPMLRVMAGEGLNKLSLNEPVDLAKVKVYYMLDNNGGLLTTPVREDLRTVIIKAASHMDSFTEATSKKVNLPMLRKSLEMWSALMNKGGNDSFCSLMGRGKPVNPLFELIRWLALCPRHTLPAIGLGILEKLPMEPAEVQKLREMTKNLQKDFSNLLGDDGVFLYPPAPTAAPYHNQPITMPFNCTYFGVFNVLGLPVTQVPMGLDTHGLPTGVQVVGNIHRDHLTIAVAGELERAFGGWVPPFKQS